MHRSYHGHSLNTFNPVGPTRVRAHPPYTVFNFAFSSAPKHQCYDMMRYAFCLILVREFNRVIGQRNLTDWYS